MELQDFVTLVVESLGGIVVPEEYALCHVMVPENRSGLLGGKTEQLLAFDYEVCEENPGSEFITFGSRLLDSMVEAASTAALCSTRFAVVDKPAPQNAAEKIKRSLPDTGWKNISIRSEKPVLVLWAVFNFRSVFMFDERAEEPLSVWVNLVTGGISDGMREKQLSIFYETAPVYAYPVPVLPDLSAAFRTAYRHAMSQAREMSAKYARESDLEKELNRLESYYSDLMEENRRRQHRKGISEEHLHELESKLSALALERDKQKREMADKYDVKVKLHLDNGMIYAVPAMEYDIKMEARDTSREATAYYNPVLKEFDVLCDLPS